MSNRQSIPSTDLPMGIDPFGKGLLGRNPSPCSGGENVSSIEVESAISFHPEVTEVAVIGVLTKLCST